MPNADPALLRQLSDNSAPYRDPLALVDWDKLDTSSDWLPETALSLYGLPEYGTLSGAVKRRLSQYEFVNVMCCGLWLEAVFLRRLTRRLDPARSRAEHEQLLHELREETGHGLMFLKAIEAGGLPLPEGAWRPPRVADLIASRAPAAGTVFWLAAVVGEEVPDKFNRYVRAHADSINPAVRQIVTLHVVDEARHIAAARARLEARLARGAAWRRALLAPVANLLLRQIVDTFYLPPARFYELAGLTRGRWWRRRAARNPLRREFMAQLLAPTLRLLEGYGLRPKL